MKRSLKKVVGFEGGYRRIRVNCRRQINLPSTADTLTGWSFPIFFANCTVFTYIKGPLIVVVPVESCRLPR